MKSLTAPARKLPLLCMAIVAAALCSLIACEQPSNEANRAIGASSTSTQIQDPLAATKRASDERYNEYAAGIRTAAANNPTNIPGPPPTDTPGIPPTPTPVLGIQPCPAPAHPQLYSFKNCWGGIVNSTVIYAAIGGERRLLAGGGKGGNGSWVGDPSQGVVAVYENDQEYIYYSPAKIGMLGVISANGARLTLSQVDPNDRRYFITNGPTIVFDAATREFITASGTPIPATPVPIPLVLQPQLAYMRQIGVGANRIRPAAQCPSQS
jgi:hypothetical protein